MFLDPNSKNKIESKTIKQNKNFDMQIEEDLKNLNFQTPFNNKSNIDVNTNNEFVSRRKGNNVPSFLINNDKIESFKNQDINSKFPGVKVENNGASVFGKDSRRNNYKSEIDNSHNLNNNVHNFNNMSESMKPNFINRKNFFEN